MTTTRETLTELHSELPIEKLLELSKSVAATRYQKYYYILKCDSLLLNPTRRGAGTNYFLDITGLRGLLAQYSDPRTKKPEQLGNAPDVPLGTVANREWQLRELWRKHEYHLKVNGFPLTDLPTGHMAEDIACLAVNVKITQEELTKMRKVVGEYDEQKAASVKENRNRVGSCQRSGAPHYRINRVDGMDVDANGVITEIGQHVDDYLAEVKTEKERQRLVRTEAKQA